MKKLFSVDGPIIEILTKLGQLIYLTALWILGCIPIVTIATSSAAFYYAVIKSVRREVGYPVREFIAAFKRNLKSSVIISVVMVVWIYVLCVNLNYMNHAEAGNRIIMYLGTLMLLALTGCFLLYLFPVMSRFSVSIGRWCKMAFYLMIARLPYTLLMAVSLVALVWVLFFYVSSFSVLIIPGVWCYGATYLMEPGLKRLMGPRDESQPKEWFDE